MIKKMSFPADEIKSIQGQSTIVTTRVSQEYNKYHLGEMVLLPWMECYTVSGVLRIHDIHQHPFYTALTPAQIQLISKYKRIDVITLKKGKTP